MKNHSLTIGKTYQFDPLDSTFTGVLRKITQDSYQFEGNVCANASFQRTTEGLVSFNIEYIEDSLKLGFFSEIPTKEAATPKPLVIGQTYWLAKFANATGVLVSIGDKKIVFKGDDTANKMYMVIDGLIPMDCDPEEMNEGEFEPVV